MSDSCVMGPSAQAWDPKRSGNGTSLQFHEHKGDTESEDGEEDVVVRSWYTVRSVGCAERWGRLSGNVAQ